MRHHYRTVRKIPFRFAKLNRILGISLGPARVLLIMQTVFIHLVCQKSISENEQRYNYCYFSIYIFFFYLRNLLSYVYEATLNNVHNKRNGSLLELASGVAAEICKAWV